MVSLFSWLMNIYIYIQIQTSCVITVEIVGTFNVESDYKFFSTLISTVLANENIFRPSNRNLFWTLKGFHLIISHGRETSISNF